MGAIFCILLQEYWNIIKIVSNLNLTSVEEEALTPETTVFLLTIALGAVHFMIGAITYTLQVGPMAALGSRDNLPERENTLGIRGERANHNFKETLPWALGLLVLVQVTDAANAMTALGAWMYFIGRAVYLPLYVFGVPIVRSFAYGLALAGLGVMASQLL